MYVIRTMCGHALVLVLTIKILLSVRSLHNLLKNIHYL